MEAHQYRDVRTTLVCFFFFALFIGNVIVWQDIWQGPLYLLTFFDVGQGDAVFLKTPWGHKILIDGGPDRRVEEKLGRRLLPWDKTIDLVILTHPDHDHVAGLIGVLNHFRVAAVLWTGVRRTTLEYGAWQEVLKKERSFITIAQARQRIFWQNQGPHSLDIVWPVGSHEGKVVDVSNESSIVGRIALSQHTALLTGDIPGEVERGLVQGAALLASDILKVAHHGSKYSSTDGFIERAAPQVAVISVGADNSYGHPAKETLAKLARHGIQIRRTDTEGDISFLLK